MTEQKEKNGISQKVLQELSFSLSCSIVKPVRGLFLLTLTVSFYLDLCRRISRVDVCRVTTSAIKQKTLVDQSCLFGIGSKFLALLVFN